MDVKPTVAVAAPFAYRLTFPEDEAGRDQAQTAAEIAWSTARDVARHGAAVVFTTDIALSPAMAAVLRGLGPERFERRRGGAWEPFDDHPPHPILLRDPVGPYVRFFSPWEQRWRIAAREEDVGDDWSGLEPNHADVIRGHLRGAEK